MRWVVFPWFVGWLVGAVVSEVLIGEEVVIRVTCNLAPIILPPGVC